MLKQEPLLKELPDMHYATLGNCADALACSVLQAYNKPFQWIFSNTWNFYYHSLEEMTAYESKLMINPVLWNAHELFGMNLIALREKNFDRLIEKLHQYNCLLFSVETYYLPWCYGYQMSRNNFQLFAVQQYDEANRQILVWSIHHRGYIPAEIIKQSFERPGASAFAFMPPTKSLTDSILSRQFQITRDKIMGTTTQSYASGLKGLTAFKEHLEQAPAPSSAYAALWFAQFKEITHLKICYINYLHYLQHDESSPLRHSVPPELILHFMKAVSHFTAFRNILTKTVFNKSYNRETVIRQLEKVIESEYECAIMLENHLLT